MQSFCEKVSSLTFAYKSSETGNLRDILDVPGVGFEHLLEYTDDIYPVLCRPQAFLVEQDDVSLCIGYQTIEVVTELLVWNLISEELLNRHVSVQRDEGLLLNDLRLVGCRLG